MIGTLAALAVAAAAAPQEADVNAAVQRLFDAMAARDGAAVAEIVLPGSLFTRITPTADGRTTIGRFTAEDFAKGLRAGMHEEMWAQRVSQRGDALATVSGPYEFKLDGKTTHCGIDVFDLAKVDGRWRIASGIWTVEPEACAELKARR